MSYNDFSDQEEELSINSDDEEVVLMETESSPSSTWLIVDETKHNAKIDGAFQENDVEQIGADDTTITCFPKNGDDALLLDRSGDSNSCSPKYPHPKGRARLYTLMIAAAVLATMLLLLLPRLYIQGRTKTTTISWRAIAAQTQNDTFSCFGDGKKQNEDVFLEVDNCLVRAKLSFQLGECASNYATTFKYAHHYFWSQTTHTVSNSTWQPVLSSHLRHLYNAFSQTKERLSTNLSYYTSVKNKVEEKKGYPNPKPSALTTWYHYYHKLANSWIHSTSHSPVRSSFSTENKLPTARSAATNANNAMNCSNGTSNTTLDWLSGGIIAYYNYSKMITDTIWVTLKNVTNELVEAMKAEASDDGDNIYFTELGEVAYNYSSLVSNIFWETVENISKKASVLGYSLDESESRFFTEMAEAASNYSAKLTDSMWASLESAYNYSTMATDSVWDTIEHVSKEALTAILEESFDEDSLFAEFAEAAANYSIKVTERVWVAFENVSKLVVEGIMEETHKDEDAFIFEELVEAACKSVAHAWRATQTVLTYVFDNNTVAD